jgi:hypothetical protein
MCVVMPALRCAGGRQRGRGCSAALQPAYERREHVGWRCEARGTTVSWPSQSLSVFRRRTLRRRWETCISDLRRRWETHALVASCQSAYSTRIDIGSGKCRGLVRVRRGMRWSARLPYMPLEVISILHLLTCITTRPGRCCFPLFYSYFTRALLLLYI